MGQSKGTLINPIKPEGIRDMYPIGTIMYQLITNILAPVRIGLDPRKAVWIQFYWNYRMMNIITNRICYGCYDWVEYECHAYSLPHISHVLMLMFLITSFGHCKSSLNLTFLKFDGRLNLWVCWWKGTLIIAKKPEPFHTWSHWHHNVSIDYKYTATSPNRIRPP